MLALFLVLNQHLRVKVWFDFAVPEEIFFMVFGPTCLKLLDCELGFSFRTLHVCAFSVSLGLLTVN